MDKNVPEQKATIKLIKDSSDLLAQDVQGQVAQALGFKLFHQNFETKGEFEGGLVAGAVTGDVEKGEATFVVSDVIEGTTMNVFARPGASSIHIQGPGATTFGMFPDEVRALMVTCNINNKLIDRVIAEHNRGNEPVASLEEFLDPLLPVETLLARIALLNDDE